MDAYSLEFKFFYLNTQLRRGTEARFVSFLSGGFITTIVANPLERKLAKPTPVQRVGNFHNFLRPFSESGLASRNLIGIQLSFFEQLTSAF